MQSTNHILSTRRTILDKALRLILNNLTVASFIDWSENFCKFTWLLSLRFLCTFSRRLTARMFHILSVRSWNWIANLCKILLKRCLWQYLRAWNLWHDWSIQLKPNGRRSFVGASSQISIRRLSLFFYESLWWKNGCFIFAFVSRQAFSWLYNWTWHRLLYESFRLILLGVLDHLLRLNCDWFLYFYFVLNLAYWLHRWHNC